MVRPLAVLALAGAVSVGGLVAPARADDWGIDVSRWQGCGMSFSGVDDFVIAKVGGSDWGTYADSCYAAFAARVRAQGKKLGHYWFAGAGSGAADADFFVNHLSQYRAGDPLVYDTEAQWVSPAKATAFVKRVKARLGSSANVFIYTSQGNLAAYNWSGVVATGARLWVARYGANTGGVVSSGAISWWPDWTIHQYTSRGVISGYSGRLDGDRAKAGAWTAPSAASASTLGTATTPAASVNAWGYQVTQIQKLLNARGNYGLVVDGIQGSATTRAVRAYQAAHGLTVDGIVGPATWASLNGATSTHLTVDGWLGAQSVTRLQQLLGTRADGVISGQNAYTASHLTHLTSLTRTGGGSLAVSALQHRLGITPDGYLGPQTIKAWQRKLGVTPDGYLGAQTAAAIQRALNNGKLW